MVRCPSETFFERMGVVVVLMACYALIAHFGLVSLKRSTLTDVLGLKGFLIPMETHYALNGRWPQPSELPDGLFDRYFENRDRDSTIQAVDVGLGAVHVELGRLFSGSTLSMRFGAFAENPTGPVIWMPGSEVPDDGWVLFGEDRTTLARHWVMNWAR